MKIETFTLRSNDLGGVATLREAHEACGGDNVSPQLYWLNVPDGTKSFALTMYDRDAPTGSGFWHWMVFDIPPMVMEIPAGAGDPGLHLMPKAAVQSINDYGQHGYGGPKPPHGHGWHNYMITIYALKVAKLGLTRDALPAQVGFLLWLNTIEKASMVFYYER